MSYKELVGWSKYLAHEPVNSTEVQLALLSQIVSSFGGGKAKLNDLLITQYKGKSKDVSSFASEDDVARIFSLLASS